MILRDRSCSTSGITFSWQAQYFRQVEWKNRKMHWHEAVSSALNFPFLKEVSQNCSPHLCVGFLFLVLHPVRRLLLPPPPVTHHLSTHHFSSHHLSSHNLSSDHFSSHHLSSHHFSSHYLSTHNLSSHFSSHHLSSYHLSSHYLSTHNFVALRDICLIVTLRGRRGTYGTGLALAARLVSHGAVTPRPFAWQAWHFVTSAFTLRGRRGIM